MGKNCRKALSMVNKRILTNSTLEEVKQYSRQLKKAQIDFDRLIVFGSQAKGISHKDSDIDVCVVSKKFGKNRYDERGVLMKVTNDQTTQTTY